MSVRDFFLTVVQWEFFFFLCHINIINIHHMLCIFAAWLCLIYITFIHMHIYVWRWTGTIFHYIYYFSAGANLGRKNFFFILKGRGFHLFYIHYTWRKRFPAFLVLILVIRAYSWWKSINPASQNIRALSKTSKVGIFNAEMAAKKSVRWDPGSYLVYVLALLYQVSTTCGR